MPAKLPSKSEIVKLFKEWEKRGKPAFSVLAKELKRDVTTVKRWLTSHAERYGLEPAVVESTSKISKQKKQLFEAAMADARGNTSAAAKHLGLTEREFSKELQQLGGVEGFYKDLPKVNTYVITSAQNATPVNANFLSSLKQYCKYNNAELVIIPLRYKNPTSLWTNTDDKKDWWDESILPYLCDTRQILSPNLLLLADVKTQPTASDPLSGFESISQDKSGVVGHPKVALKTVAVPNHKTPKLLITTGSVTVNNYTPTKAGKKGEFHHSQSAIVVELDGKQFHTRHLSAVKDGSFIDLDKEYTVSGVRQAPPAEALIMGDTHAQFADDVVLRTTLEGRNSIAGLIKPKHFVWHDILDFYSANHHHKHQPFIHLAKHRSGLNIVRDEVVRTFELVNKYMTAYPGSVHVFPESNHNAAFGRWMRECDWREDPANAEFYLQTALHMATHTRMGTSGSETPNPFIYWGTQLLEHVKRTRFLSTGESFIVKDIDVGQHGHLGPNGSRGSIRSLSKIGVKTFIGHSHSPGIHEGAYQVGTSSRLQLEYNQGPSSWLHTHGIIYANGKRTLIHVINGEYTNKRGKK